jgi:signal transduction histidine kinase
MNKHQQELLMDMYRSTEASIATVNEILDLSIFERGQADNLQHEQVDLTTVITQIIATLKLGAQEKKIHILLLGEWPEHAFTTGDVGALRRAFMNLVANAIKYSHNGSKIEISYRLANTEHIIAIRDYGIGIPAAEQSKVINGYYRASNATQVQAHGTGLGLWLARMLAEQHHGRLWLSSRINNGTTIYVALPAATSSVPFQAAH